MLPILHKNKLITFQHLVTDLLSLLDSIDWEDQESKKIPPVLIQEGKKLLTYFQSEILTLKEDEIDLSLRSSWLSFQTETHRCLRLLTTELLFLASSNNPQTREQRIVKIKKILEQITSLIDG
jgi:hypothetical protein